MSNNVQVIYDGKRKIISHMYEGENIEKISDIKENETLFECLAMNTNKNIRNEVSKKHYLNKRAKFILGFMDKFSSHMEIQD